jgi:hypothetical protein
MSNSGFGYVNPPVVTINAPVGGGTTATAVAVIGAGQTVQSIRITNPGIGYTTNPIVTIQNPPLLVGVGTFIFNEEIIGSTSGTKGRVKSWDKDTKILKVSFVDSTATKGFYAGEIVVGSDSAATYLVGSYSNWDQYDKYSENQEIEIASDNILDFSESNPFGVY